MRAKNSRMGVVADRPREGVESIDGGGKEQVDPGDPERAGAQARRRALGRDAAQGEDRSGAGLRPRAEGLDARRSLVATVLAGVGSEDRRDASVVGQGGPLGLVAGWGP